MANTSYDQVNPPDFSTRVEPLALNQALVLRSGAAANNLNIALKKLALANRPASEFDNFYTPKNDNFYSKSPYFKLDETRHEIRLLKVYPEKKTYNQHLLEHPEWKEHEDVVIPQTRVTSNHSGTYTQTRLQRPPQIFPGRNLEEPVIACELVDTVPLSRVDGNYHALSYCAGSPKDVSRILVNGIFFNAFANLEHAIECAMTFWGSRNPGKELLLWVDQICINQEDQAERSSQVGLMQDIYRRSQDAVICISTHDARPLNYYRLLGPNPPGKAIWMHYGLHPRGKSPSGSSPFQDIDLFVRDKIQSGNNQALADLPACFESLCTFLSSPWWGRAWVYQEFIMAPRAYFVCKTNAVDTVSWAELSLVFEEVLNLKEKTLDNLASEISEWIQAGREEERTEIELGQEEIARQRKEWDEANRESILREIEQLNIQKASLTPILERAEEEENKNFHWRKSNRKLLEDYPKYRSEMHIIDNKLQSLNWRLVGYIANPRQEQLDHLKSILKILSTAQASVDQVRRFLPRLRSSMEPVTSLMRGKSTRRRVFGLKEVLDHSRRCQASDPRDKIYAFLGLSDKGYGIVPIYSWENTIIHVLLHTAQKIIAFEGTLDILEHVRQGREKLGHLLPSWVPDWTSNDLQLFAHEFLERVTEIRRKYGNNGPFQASKSEVAKPEFVNDRSNECNVDMKVNAIFVESLEDIDGSPYDESPLQTFLTPSGLQVHTSQVATCGDEVWILYGARSPMVLRSEPGGRYSFLSQALICESNGKISDIMFGSKMVELEANAKNITIV